jgi:hypothetical protein
MNDETMSIDSLISRSMPVFSNLMCILLEILMMTRRRLIRRVPRLVFSHAVVVQRLIKDPSVVSTKGNSKRRSHPLLYLSHPGLNEYPPGKPSPGHGRSRTCF